MDGEDCVLLGWFAAAVAADVVDEQEGRGV